MIYTNDYKSPLGNILLAGDERGLTGLWFTEGGRYIRAGLQEGAGRREMCEIPFGKTVTYGWIADRIAKERGLEKMSAQAVGGAVGHNPVCIIVPCHRVIGANGSLTGYGGGILRKKALLELEGNDMSHFSIPAKGTAL